MRTQQDTEGAAPRLSRAAAVRLGSVGVAAAVGGMLIDAAPAEASSTDDQFIAKNGGGANLPAAFTIDTTTTFNYNAGIDFTMPTGSDGVDVTVDNDGAGVIAIQNGSGDGLNGDAVDGDGVRGSSSGSGNGVYGFINPGSAGGAGVLGNVLFNGPGDGVLGTTGGPGNGVHGSVSGAGDGVLGEAGTGNGVHGISRGPGLGAGVLGFGPTGVAGSDNGGDPAGGTGGIGVKGSTTSGIGVQANAANPSATALQATNAGGGVALQVRGVSTFEGVTAFSRSGLATVNGSTATPKNSVKVSSVSLTASSLVLATIQGDPPGTGIAVQGVVTNPTKSTLTIYLTQMVSTHVKVAWLVLG